jgi:hypothetical protein
MKLRLLTGSHLALEVFGGDLPRDQRFAGEVTGWLASLSSAAPAPP